MIKPTWQYYVTLCLTLLIIAWVCSSAVTRLLEPEIDADAQAYIVLLSSINQPYYTQVESGARQAQAMTTDGDIRKLSDFIARISNLSIRAGSSTTEEAASFSGFGKAFVNGFVNPAYGIEGGLIYIEGLLTDYEAIGNRLDERYQPIFSSYRFAEAAGQVMFWVLIAGSVIAYFLLRRQYEQAALQRLMRFKVLNLESVNSETVATEPN